MKDKIYTRNVAADIIEAFENILIENNICVPSPEDDERDEDNMIGLYGSVYYDLLDAVETRLVDILNQNASGAEVVSNVFE